MIAVAYLLFFGVYLLISLAVVAWIAIRAKKRGRNPLLWGLGALLVMYNLVFWDWLPSKAQHDYYCRNQAGFWVYKTLDQWEQENPRVYETLVRNKGLSNRIYETKGPDKTERFLLNDRFEWDVTKGGVELLGVDLGLGFRQEMLVDRNTRKTLAKYVDFHVGPSLSSGGLRFWKAKEHCDNGETNRDIFLDYSEPFRGVRQ